VSGRLVQGNDVGPGGKFSRGKLVAVIIPSLGTSEGGGCPQNLDAFFPEGVYEFDGPGRVRIFREDDFFHVPGVVAFCGVLAVIVKIADQHFPVVRGCFEGGEGSYELVLD